MTPDTLISTAISPAISDLESEGIPVSREAKRMLIAIAMQESGLSYRRQVVNGTQSGPAASFWQFEKGGGCRGVLTHPAVSNKMKSICHKYNVDPTEGGLWEAILYQDIVAACAARCLLYTLPNALPTTAQQGWDQYVSAWRPGKPHRNTWDGYWDIAEKLT